MKKLLFTLLIVCAGTTHAATPTKRSIETLLAETKIERSIGGMMDSMNGMMRQQMAGVRSQHMSPAQQKAMQTMQDRMAALLRSELTWQNLEPIYVQVYQETYTQAEVDGLIAFYRTPTGRSYVDKMPQALQKTFVAMQPLMNSMMQKAQAIAERAAEEVQAGDPAPAAPAAPATSSPAPADPAPASP